MLAYCFSLNSDVSMLLRRCGLFSIMIINHDIKMLTKNPEAKLNENQRKLMEDIGRQLTRSDFDDSKKDKKPKRKEGLKVRLLP